MSRDLVIGLLVSLLLHAGLALGFSPKPAPPARRAPPPAIEIIAIPPLEPDLPAPGESSDQPSDTAPLAPPMRADLPSVNLETSFVQPIEPPPPPNLGRPAGLITIPASRPGAGLGGGFGAIFELANLDQPPSIRFDARPVYPYEMRHAGIAGEVEVGFVIDSEGNARDAYVIRSSQREFEAAATDAVLKSKFNPGKKGGRAVNTRVRRTIVFSVTGAD